jgi:hypothetical protein
MSVRPWFDLGWREFGEDGKDTNRDLNRALRDREAWDDEEEEAAGMRWKK